MVVEPTELELARSNSSAGHVKGDNGARPYVDTYSIGQEETCVPFILAITMTWSIFLEFIYIERHSISNDRLTYKLATS